MVSSRDTSSENNSVRPVSTRYQRKSPARGARREEDGTTTFSPISGGGPAGRQSGRYPSNPKRQFDLGKKKRNSPTKVVVAVLIVLVLAVGGAIGAEFALNDGKVHPGVTIEGIDIGGLTKAEATAQLQTQFDAKLAANAVQATPDTTTAERLTHRSVGEGAVVTAVGNETAPDGDSEGEAGDASTEGAADVDTEATDDATAGGMAATGASDSALSWTFSPTDLGVSYDVGALVDAAYEVGQVDDFADFFPALGDRLNSWMGNVNIEATLTLDTEKVAASLHPVNDVVGVQMVNSSVGIGTTGIASVQTGQIGQTIDVEAFAAEASQRLLGRIDRAITIPLTNIPLAIDDTEAQAVADSLNNTLATPVTLVYQDSQWQADASLIGSWITTAVEGEGETAQLVASLDTVKAYEGLQTLLGDAGYGTAQNAHLDFSSGAPVIVGGTPGVGPDLRAAAEVLNTILFLNPDAARQVTFANAEVEPAVTAEEVAAMGITEKIASFTLGYGSGGGSNREFNIERVLTTLNNSTIAPGGDWNWNEVVGQCDETTGYLDAGAINDKNEIVQEPGGGICNVATAVFNVAYEAGLPITERANHSIFMPNYPLGRDAAVSWQYPTLVFQNDTDHHIMMTASYDGTNMTLDIWGTSEHRTVESSNSEWADTSEGGRTITNYRTIKNADGSVYFQDSFYSYFPPEND